MRETAKPGRPPGSKSRKPTRNMVKQVRWTAEEWETVEKQAEKDGMPKSEFIRRTTLTACEP